MLTSCVNNFNHLGLKFRFPVEFPADIVSTNTGVCAAIQRKYLKKNPYFKIDFTKR